MTDLDKRREVWDTKLATDSELRFKVAMHRNKLLGRWVADELRLEGDAAQDVIDRVVKSDFEEAGDEDVIRAVIEILRLSGIDIDDATVRTQLSKAQGEAIDELGASD